MPCNLRSIQHCQTRKLLANLPLGSHEAAGLAKIIIFSTIFSFFVPFLLIEVFIMESLLSYFKKNIWNFQYFTRIYLPFLFLWLNQKVLFVKTVFWVIFRSDQTQFRTWIIVYSRNAGNMKETARHEKIKTFDPIKIFPLWKKPKLNLIDDDPN